MNTESPFKVDFKEEGQTTPPQQPEQVKAPKEKSSKGVSMIVVGLLIVVVALLAGGLFWTYKQYMDSKQEVEELKDPGKYAERMDEEAQAIVDQLALLMVLPDEKPTVATVVDAAALKEENPNFYKDAQNGDRLIIYSTKAILFRAEEEKIINVAPVQITPTEESGETMSLKVDVHNGTTTDGKENEMATDIGEAGSYQVVNTGSAQKTDYEKTTVYDLTNGAKSDQVKTLADSIGAEYSESLPEDESSTSEVLVIVGQDY